MRAPLADAQSSCNSDIPTFGRREMLVGISAAALTSCGGGSGSSTAPAAQVPASPDPVPTPSPVSTAVASETIDPQQFYKPEHGDNWQPALQAAFTAGAQRNLDVILTRERYNCRQQDQTGANPNIHTDYHRALFYVESSIRMRTVNSTGSQIIRLAPNGSPMGPGDYYDAGGYKWRGGLFLMRSQSTTPSIDPSLYSFTSHGVLFDGGLRRSMAIPWEIGDKGLWQANDRNCGNITITGTPTAPGGFIGTTSELIYTSAISGPEASRRFLSIDENSKFGETSLSCLNPNGITLRVERCLCYNAFIGIEGWTGENGGYLKALFRNCSQSAIQGGTVNQDSSRGNHFTYTYPTPGLIPLGYLDVVLENSSGFALGSGLRGTVLATDSIPSIGDASVFNHGVKNTDVEIVSVVDTFDYNPGVLVLGGASGSLATDDIILRLRLQRTARAAGLGKRHINGVGSYGSFGPNVSIKIMESYPEVASNWVALAAIYDNHPHVTVG